MDFKVTLSFIAVFCYVSKVSCLRFCYFTNWAQHRPGAASFTVKNIDPFLCSHIVYAYAWLSGSQLTHTQANDEPSFDDLGQYHRVVQLKEQNPELKVLLAVAGLDVGSLPFSTMLASSVSRRQFILSALGYLRLRDFDGIDLDLEYPGRRRGIPTDTKDLNRLLTEMRHYFHEEANQTGQEELLITAVVPHGDFFTETGYDVQVVSSMLDYIFVMTYDFHGPWESRVGHPSPLHPRTGERGENAQQNMVSAMNYWIGLGVPRSKLVASVALYGRTYALVDAGNHTMGVPDNGSGPAASYTQEPGFIAYYEICELLKQGARRYWHPEHMVPYVVNGSTWIGYDDPESIALKMRWMKNADLAGVMIWALDLDDFVGNSCNQGVSPLLTTINLKLVDRKFNIANIPTRFATKHVRVSQLIDEILRNQSEFQNDSHVSFKSNLQVPASVKQIADSVMNTRPLSSNALHNDYTDLLKTTTEIISKKSNTMLDKHVYHPVLNEAIKHITTFQESRKRQFPGVPKESKQTSGNIRINQSRFGISSQLLRPAPKRPKLRLVDTTGFFNTIPSIGQSARQHNDLSALPQSSFDQRRSSSSDKAALANTHTTTTKQAVKGRISENSPSVAAVGLQTNNVIPSNINMSSTHINNATHTMTTVQQKTANNIRVNNLPEPVSRIGNNFIASGSANALLPPDVSFLRPNNKHGNVDRSLKIGDINSNGRVSDTRVSAGTGISESAIMSSKEPLRGDSSGKGMHHTEFGSKVVYTGGMKMKSKSMVDSSKIVQVSPQRVKLRLVERVTSGTFTSTLRGTTIPTSRMDMSNTLPDQIPASRDLGKRKNTVKHINIPVAGMIPREKNRPSSFADASKGIEVMSNMPSTTNDVNTHETVIETTDAIERGTHGAKAKSELSGFRKNQFDKMVDKPVIPVKRVDISNTLHEIVPPLEDAGKSIIKISHTTIPFPAVITNTTQNGNEPKPKIHVPTNMEVFTKIRPESKIENVPAAMTEGIIRGNHIQRNPGNPGFSSNQLVDTNIAHVIPTSTIDIAKMLPDKVQPSPDDGKTDNNLKNLGVPVPSLMDDVTMDRSATNRGSTPVAIFEMAEAINRGTPVERQSGVSDVSLNQLDAHVRPTSRIVIANTIPEIVPQSQDVSKTNNNLMNFGVPVPDLMTIDRSETNRDSSPAAILEKADAIRVGLPMERQSGVSDLSSNQLDVHVRPTSSLIIANTLPGMVPPSQDIGKTNANLKNFGVPVSGQMDDMSPADRLEIHRGSAPVAFLETSEASRRGIHVTRQSSVSDVSSIQSVDTIGVPTTSIDIANTLPNNVLPLRDVDKRNTNMENMGGPVSGLMHVWNNERQEYNRVGTPVEIVEMAEAIKRGTQVKRNSDVPDSNTNQFVETIDIPLIPTNKLDLHKLPPSQDIVKPSETIKHISVPITTTKVNPSIKENMPQTEIHASKGNDVIAETRPINSRGDGTSPVIKVNEAVTRDSHVNNAPDVSDLSSTQFVDTRAVHVTPTRGMDMSNTLRDKAPPSQDVDKTDKAITTKSVPVASPITNTTSEDNVPKSNIDGSKDMTTLKDRPETSRDKVLAFILKMVESMRKGTQVQRTPGVSNLNSNQLVEIISNSIISHKRDTSKTVNGQASPSQGLSDTNTNIKQTSEPAAVPMRNNKFKDTVPVPNLDSSKDMNMKAKSRPDTNINTIHSNIVMAETIAGGTRVDRTPDVPSVNDIQALETIDALLTNILTEYHTGLKLKSKAVIDSARVIKTSPRKAKIRMFERVGAAVFSPTISQHNMVDAVEDNAYDFNTLGIKL